MNNKNTKALCDTLFDLMMEINDNNDEDKHESLVTKANAMLPLAQQYTDVKRVETENYNAVNKRAEILAKFAPDQTVKALGYGND